MSLAGRPLADDVEFGLGPEAYERALEDEKSGKTHIEFVDGVPVLRDGPPRFPGVATNTYEAPAAVRWGIK